MKKIKKFFRELWLERDQLLSMIAYIILVGWYGYALIIIAESDIPLFPCILMFVGGLIFALVSFVGLRHIFSSDEK